MEQNIDVFKRPSKKKSKKIHTIIKELLKSYSKKYRITKYIKKRNKSYVGKTKKMSIIIKIF